MTDSIPDLVSKFRRDALDIEKTLNEKIIVNPRLGNSFRSLPLAIQEVIETGGFEPFATEVQLKATVPVLTKKAAYALNTHKIWLWNNGQWVDTGLSAIDQAKADAKIKADKALVDAKTYADTKKSEAISTAASDASTKSTLALVEAKADAKIKADNALVDAKNYADTKKSEAIEYTDQTAIQKHTSFSRDGMLFEVTDALGNQTWLQISDKDGLPTSFAKKAIQEANHTYLGAKTFSEDEHLLYCLQDQNGNLTALAVRQSDGMFAQFVIDDIAKRINLPDPNEQLDLGELQYKPKPSDFQILSSIARGVARHVEKRPLPSRVTSLVNSTNQNVRFTFPNNYTDATPLILMICFEGIGDPNLDIRAYYADLSNHGVIWARCDFHGNHYGNPQSMQDAKELYQKACELAPIGGVVMVGNSMGGIAALNALTTEAVPNILGVYLTDPTFDLRQRYDNGRAGDINSAYNCTAETYAEKTKGYDPAKEHWSKFKGVPIKVVATSNDTLVTMAAHTNKIVEKLQGHNDLQVVDTLAPNHNSPAIFNINELLPFVHKCANGVVLTTV